MDVHFNSYKVRYELMDHLLNPIVRSRPIKNVTFYINLDDVFHNLHRPLTNNEFQVAGVNAAKQVMSNVLNLIGHYRQWAIRRYFNVTVVGAFTSARKYFKNSLYVPNYRKKYMNICDKQNTQYFFVNEAIFSAMPLLTTISHYLDKIYIIDSKYLEPSMVPMWLSENKFTNSDWNVLISRDTYDVQYAYRDKWTLIYPKSDMSNVVNRENLWDHINMREKVYKDERYVNLKYGQDLFLTCKAITGDVYRSVPRLGRIGWITIFKYLEELSHDRISGPMEIQLQLEELLRNKKKVTMNEFNANRMAVDVDMQCSTINDIEKSIIETDIIDILDYKSLQELNSRYFKEYPINLIFLTQVQKPATYQHEMMQRQGYVHY